MPPKGWRKNSAPKTVVAVPIEKKPEEPKVATEEIEMGEEVTKQFPSFDDVRAAVMEQEHKRGQVGPHGRMGPPGLHDAL